LIESVSLHNWKTHADSRLEFGKGTNVIVGKMGAGKSSVMDAICFALFGTFPALQARRVSLEEVIMSKPNQAEEAMVELAFSYGEKKYIVERKIKRKGSSEAKLHCDGKFVAGPKPRDVNEAIEKAIEIGYNLFSRAVYSEQNEIDAFLRLAASERKAKFDELLDLEKYETVRANAVTAMNQLKRIAKERKGWIAEQKKMILGQEEEKLLQKIRGKEKESVSLQEFAESRQKTVQLLLVEVKQLEEKETVSRRLREEASEKKAAAMQIEKMLQEAKKEAGGKSIVEIEKRIELLEKDITGEEKKGKEIEAEEEKEREKKEALGKEAALNQKKSAELGEQLQELELLGAECPTCRQKIDAKTREQLVQETMQEAKKAKAEMDKALALEAEASAKIAKLRAEARETKKAVEAAREKFLREKQLLGSLQKAAEKERQMNRLLDEAQKALKTLQETDFDEKRLLLKRRQSIEEKSAIDSAKKEISANRQLLQEMNSLLERIEKTRKQLQEAEKGIAAMEESSAKMDCFVNSLVAAQNELRETLIATINEAMHDIWQEAYPYKDLVSAKMDVGEGTYELKAKERNGKWVRVEGILSGGERSAAAICIRISFSLVLARNLGWLILDEPTHNLDSTAVQTLSKMMQLHLPSLVDQIFVITHDMQMRKAASASLYVIEREKGEDGISKPVLAPIEE